MITNNYTNQALEVTDEQTFKDTQFVNCTISSRAGRFTNCHFSGCHFPQAARTVFVGCIFETATVFTTSQETMFISALDNPETAATANTTNVSYNFEVNEANTTAYYFILSGQENNITIATPKLTSQEDFPLRTTGGKLISHLNAKDAVELIKLYNQLYKLTPSVSKLVMLADAYYKTQGYAAATETLEKVLVEDSTAWVYYNLAVVQKAAAQKKAAQVNIQKALAAEPENPTFQAFLASLN